MNSSEGTARRSRVWRGAVLAAGVAAATVLGTGTASASLGQCADNRLCAWSDDNYGGIFTSYTASAPALGGDNDRFDSLWNRNSITWFVFVDANNQGSRYCLRPGYSVSRLSDWFNLHDKISSVQKQGTSSCGSVTPIGSYHGS